MKRVTMGLSFSFLTVGCSFFTAPDEVMMGNIGYPDQVETEVPAEAQVGQPFEVVVRADPPSRGCWRSERTDVRVDGSSVTVTPYLARSRGTKVVCTGEAVRYRHTADVIAMEAGEVTVEIRGRDGSVFRSVTLTPTP